MSAGKKAIREQFRNDVFNRDKGKCVQCGRTSNQMDAHHITDRSLMPAGGYVKENGISLCPEDHLIAEKFHTSGGRAWDQGMHPEDLYRKIGSSYDKAVAASLELEKRLARSS